MKDFDLAVIGAGPGGLEAALGAAELGLKTALIEKKEIGGTCLNTGCIPTKALLASARFISRLHHAEKLGLPRVALKVSLENLMNRKNKIVSDLRAAALAGVKKSKLEWVEGAARFTGPGQLEIHGKTSQRLAAKNVIIATGSEPTVLPGLEFDGENILSSNDVLDLKKIPKSILVVGGGAVGVEFASLFHALGAKTFLAEMLERILPSEDPDCAKRLETLFARRGIRVLIATRVITCEPDKAGLRVGLQSGETLEVEKMLVAAGRRPITHDLGLEALGIGVEKNGTIPGNRYLETSARGVFAIGDVIASPQLAHVASYEGTLVVENLLAGEERNPVDYGAIPSCVYSDPEVASVGKIKRESVETGDVIEVKIPFSAVAKAQAESEIEGFFKLFAAAKDGKILGACGIGARVTELLPEISLAIRAGLTVRDLLRNVHAHPTESEVIFMAARELARRLRTHLPNSPML